MHSCDPAASLYVPGRQAVQFPPGPEKPASQVQCELELLPAGAKLPGWHAWSCFVSKLRCNAKGAPANLLVPCTDSHENILRDGEAHIPSRPTGPLSCKCQERRAGTPCWRSDRCLARTCLHGGVCVSQVWRHATHFLSNLALSPFFESSCRHHQIQDGTGRTLVESGAFRQTHACHGRTPS